jgi:hypothetical protein
MQNGRILVQKRAKYWADCGAVWQNIKQEVAGLLYTTDD